MDCIQSRIKDGPLEKYLQSTSMWFHKSFLFDWALALVLFVIAEVVTMFVNPFDRYLPPNDPSVTFPQMADIVSNTLLMILAIVVPVAIFALAQIYLKNGHDCHHALLGLFVSIALTNVVTSSLKSATGRYRPDWFSAYNGTQNEGRYSFPSGHASNAFAGMVFLSLYTMGKFRAFSGDRVVPLWKPMIGLLPLVVAIFIAASRTIDYHHNFSDVIAGSLVGTGLSFFSYFLYYPSLFSEESHLPKHHPERPRAISSTTPILMEVLVPGESNIKAAKYEGQQSPV